MAEQIRRDLEAFSNQAELVAACRRLRRHLERWQGVAEEETSGWWPADEDAAGLWQWVRTHGQLMRLLGVSTGGGARSAAPDRAEQAALAALQDEPESVVLTDGSVVDVYPKGFLAISWFDSQDRWLGQLSAWREQLWSGIARGTLPAGAGVDVEDLAARLNREEALVLGAMAAQACAPGCAPAEITAENALRFAQLPPEDLVRVYRAHMEVNYVRVMLARQLAPARKDSKKGGSPTWGGWLAGIGFRERADSRGIARDRALANLMVTYALGAPGDLDLDE